MYSKMYLIRVLSFVRDLRFYVRSEHVLGGCGREKEGRMASSREYTCLSLFLEVLEEVKTTDNKQPAGDQEKMDDEEESEEDEDALLDDDEDKMEADMEEKLKIEGDEEEHKDEGHRVGKTWLKIQELKGEVKEKIKEILPPAFKSGRLCFC